MSYLSHTVDNHTLRSLGHPIGDLEVQTSGISRGRRMPGCLLLKKIDLFPMGAGWYEVSRDRRV